MVQELRFLLAKNALYYNKKRNKDITLKKRNKIYLLQKNIKITKLSSKLNYVKIELFKILRSIKKISFKLDLPNIIRIHPIFHVSLFKLTNNATLIIIIQPGYIDF